MLLIISRVFNILIINRFVEAGDAGIKLHKRGNIYANTGVACWLRNTNAISLAKQNVPTGSVNLWAHCFFVEVC